jgi:hypothetical protein
VLFLRDRCRAASGRKLAERVVGEIRRVRRCHRRSILPLVNLSGVIFDAPEDIHCGEIAGQCSDQNPSKLRKA